jgi:Bacterial pre-peptidase C-terminal domain/Leishmanolysin
LSSGHLNNLNTDSNYSPDVVIHEIGHALGLVDLLDSSTINAANGTYNANTYAGWSYGELKETYTQTALPLRAYAGGGNDLSHWKEEVFGSETMTPSIGPSGSLSQLSLAVMRDLGWNINFGAAQPYRLPRGGVGTSLTKIETNLGSGSSGSSGGYVSYSVNSESADRLYKLSLSQLSSVNMTLSGLSANADVRLIHDANNNSIIDAGEVIQVSANSGTNAETFNLTNLAAGTYFVNVYAGSSVDSAGNRLIDNTAYRLDYATAVV